MSQKRNGQPITTVYEFNFPQPKPKVSFCKFICNTKDGTCLGRTPASWAKILIFYAIFYAVLAGLFAICLKVLFSTLKENEPKFTLDSSLIGTNPGLGYRPLSEQTERGSIIKFDTTNSDEAKYWIDLLDEFLLPYNNKSLLPNGGINQTPCDYYTKKKSGKVCGVDITSQFGECSRQNNYGYVNGRPCVFLKLNKIFNWQPEYYDDPSDLPNEMPNDLKQSIAKTKKEELSKIWVSCEGQHPLDQENIGKINYYPSRGFESYFYPYTNQPGYLSPLVAVQFVNPTHNQLISIECRAWARNVIYSGSIRDRKGSVSFQLNIDSEIKTN